MGNYWVEPECDGWNHIRLPTVGKISANEDEELQRVFWHYGFYCGVFGVSKTGEHIKKLPIFKKFSNCLWDLCENGSWYL